MRKSKRGAKPMELMNLPTLFTDDPANGYRTVIRFFHFIGLALGLGGATLLDLLVLRFFIRGRIVDETYQIFAFASKIVDIGLRILWVTGIGFLFLYALTNIELLTNPKVHAKLIIVLILTVNGFFIHTVILPTVRAQIGKSMFNGVSPARRTIFVMSGAISATSWYMPVALGAFPQLNFKVSAVDLLLIYLAGIIVMSMAMQCVIHVLHRFDPKPALVSTAAKADRPPLADKGAIPAPTDTATAFVTGRLATQKAADRNWVVRNGMKGQEPRD
jgi:hypothetical protein